MGNRTGRIDLMMKKYCVPALAGICCVYLGACSMQATYDRVPTTGRFSGEPRMVSIAPNTFFFFQPKKETAFSFTTHQANDPALKVKGGRGTYRLANWTIRPEEMITNGASVPRSVWYVPGFSAFDYTPAALIHDWLFEAHHRWDMANAAYKAAEQRGDREAMKRSAADRNAYREYEKITQNDAADIFAECIKVSMLQAEGISDEFGRRLKSEPGELPKHLPKNMAVLREAFEDNQPDDRILWAYHYFVSDDCFVKTSQKVWRDHSSDVNIYRALTSPEIAPLAVEKGYLSPWMVEQFKEVLKREEARHSDYQKAVKQGMGVRQAPLRRKILPIPFIPLPTIPVAEPKQVPEAGPSEGN
jgi:hypothetical protein